MGGCSKYLSFSYTSWMISWDQLYDIVPAINSTILWTWQSTECKPYVHSHTHTCAAIKHMQMQRHIPVLHRSVCRKHEQYFLNDSAGVAGVITAGLCPAALLCHLLFPSTCFSQQSTLAPQLQPHLLSILLPDGQTVPGACKLQHRQVSRSREGCKVKVMAPGSHSSPHRGHAVFHHQGERRWWLFPIFCNFFYPFGNVGGYFTRWQIRDIL